MGKCEKCEKQTSSPEHKLCKECWTKENKNGFSIDTNKIYKVPLWVFGLIFLLGVIFGAWLW